MDIRQLNLSGSPADIGYQHGRELKTEIHECLAIYQEVIGTQFSKLTERASELASDIKRFSADIATEIEAIAKGADVDESYIYLLNARSELMSTPDGCTALFDPHLKILGQTWDWIERIEPLFVLMRVERGDGHQILTMTEPGMVGKIGFNSAGIACTLNFLYSPGRHVGTPVHVLLRGILESTSASEAMACIERRTPGQSGNLMIGSAAEGSRNIELAGLNLAIDELDEKTFAHTNHHLNSDIPAGDWTENSHARLNTAQCRIGEHGIHCVEDFKDLLSDRSDNDNAICSQYSPGLGTKLGTVCTVIMELTRGQMHIRKGPNPAAPFYALPLAAKSA